MITAKGIDPGEEISQGSGSGEPGRSREGFCLWDEE
jgi:hypothetical protein